MGQFGLVRRDTDCKSNYGDSRRSLIPSIGKRLPGRSVKELLAPGGGLRPSYSHVCFRGPGS